MTSKPLGQGDQGEGLRDEEIASRLSSLETRVEYMEKMLQDIYNRLDNMDKRITELSDRIATMDVNHVSVKWLIYMVVILLSFVAAMFGLGWRPPH